ncbi:hypothetical protein KSP39_PZI020438 [Platanthera zijinensis]|uniref:Uncharacterized protein n=1 Tax=Platanthera zijinensis TaxID=2320716 RepID=A0AAP0FX77_9ASPA
MFKERNPGQSELYLQVEAMSRPVWFKHLIAFKWSFLPAGRIKSIKQHFGDLWFPIKAIQGKKKQRSHFFEERRKNTQTKSALALCSDGGFLTGINYRHYRESLRQKDVAECEQTRYAEDGRDFFSCFSYTRLRVSAER